MHTSKLNEALELGLDILLQLGEGIPRNPSDDYFGKEVKRTQTIIAGLTEDAILGYKPMTDKKKRAALKILVFVNKCSFYEAPPLCRYIILKMVQLTFNYGKWSTS